LRTRIDRRGRQKRTTKEREKKGKGKQEIGEKKKRKQDERKIEREKKKKRTAMLKPHSPPLPNMSIAQQLLHLGI
jgi:hypothetical protein